MKECQKKGRIYPRDLHRCNIVYEYARAEKKLHHFCVLNLERQQTSLFTGSFSTFKIMKFVVEGRRLKVLTKSVRFLARYSETTNIIIDSTGFGKLFCIYKF